MQNKLWEGVALPLILGLATFLRAHKLEVLPHWHADEGTNIYIAWTTIHGSPEWFCVKYAFVPHPPLYFFLLGWLLKPFGYEPFMHTIVQRALSVGCGVVTVLLLYFIVKKISSNSLLPLIAALLAAAHPNSVYWNRLGYANNLLPPLMMLSIYLVLRSGSIKALYLSALVAGICGSIQFLGLGYTLGFLLYAYFRQRKNFLVCSLFASLPILCAVIYSYLHAPFAYLHDLTFNSGRVNWLIFLLFLLLLVDYYSYKTALRRLPIPLIPQLVNLLLGVYGPLLAYAKQKQNLFIVWVFTSVVVVVMCLPLGLRGVELENHYLLGYDVLFPGAVGLFLVPGESKHILILSFVGFFSLFLGVGRSDHMTIPLIPYAILGASFLLRWIYTNIGERRALGLLVTGWFFPLALYTTFHSVMGGLPEENLKDRFKLVDFLNAHTSPHDLVVVDPNTARFLACKTTDLLLALSAVGEGIFYVPKSFPAERYLFNCSWRKAKFVDSSFETLMLIYKEGKEKAVLAELEKELKTKWRSIKVGQYVLYEVSTSEWAKRRNCPKDPR